jgi:hypothetical protein
MQELVNVLQTVSFTVPAFAIPFMQAFLVAFVYGLYGYFSATGNGLPITWSWALFLKTLVFALLVAYAQVQLGMTSTDAQTWATNLVSFFVALLATDKVANLILKKTQVLTPTTQAATTVAPK